MVAPITQVIKQYTRSRLVSHPYDGSPVWQPHYAYLRIGSRQKPPFIDTSLYLDIGEALTPFGPADSWAVTPGLNGVAIDATNRAHAKFVGQLGNASQFGSTLTTELKSSWATVSGAITNALLAANAVRRGRLPEAAKILGFAPPEKLIKRVKTRLNKNTGKYVTTRSKTRVWVMPGGKEVAKSLGNKWLWYSYGVRPLIDDIYNGMSVLTREPPSTKVMGSSVASAAENIGGYYQTRYVWESSVRISAYVRVSNPNLWLANQLGLINPVQWFIEGVKLSFVIDWFSNLSQVVNNMTDFQGLTIDRPITTSKHSVILREFHPYYGIAMDGKRTIWRRDITIPDVKLRFAYERFSWQRGLNAISLLVNGLEGAKR